MQGSIKYSKKDAKENISIELNPSDVVATFIPVFCYVFIEKSQFLRKYSCLADIEKGMNQESDLIVYNYKYKRG